MKKFLFTLAFLCSSALIGISGVAEVEQFKKYANNEPVDQSLTLPIVFSPSYDITFFGIERFLHAFDGAKYGKVAQGLNLYPSASFFKPFKQVQHVQGHEPAPVTKEELLTVHTPEYINNSLSKSETIARICEIPPLSAVPHWILRRKLLEPMQYATGGTILATSLAQKEGWAINLSGGYHHAKANNGEGFCVYADIPIAINKVWQQDPTKKVMIIDLDAHQGNGVSDILGKDPRVAIFDMYDNTIGYPADKKTQKVTYKHPLSFFTTTEKYLETLTKNLPKAIDEFKPDLIIYNAGTDIYEKDKLASLLVSKEGVIKRDEFVFKTALQREQSIPIAMVLSGGYTKESAEIIQDSIKNLMGTVIVPYVEKNKQ